MTRGANRVATESFWRVASENRRDVVSWDLAVAGVAAALAGWLTPDEVISRALSGLLQAEVQGVGALFGFVIAGLAVVVAFFDARFLKLLQRTETGVVGSFWPFWLISAIAVCSLLSSGVGLLVVGFECHLANRIVLVVTTLFSVWAVLAALRLIQFVVAQGVSRARQLERSHEGAGEQGNERG